MNIGSGSIDLDTLIAFSPFNRMKRRYLSLAASRVVKFNMNSGETLFEHKNRSASTVFYLLSGQIELIQQHGHSLKISSGTSQAKHPIPVLTNKIIRAVVTSPLAEILSVDREFLDTVLVWDKTGIYQVEELNTDSDVSKTTDDWMSRLIKANPFRSLPPTRIQQLFMKLERIAYRASDRVINQGDNVNYYYIIGSGVCEVSSSTYSGPMQRKIEIQTGDTFGEEYLITGTNSSLNIKMLTDGYLMRLDKDDFKNLIFNEVTKPVSAIQANKMLYEGAVWIDGRDSNEGTTSHLSPAIKIPLHFNKDDTGKMKKDLRYIVESDNPLKSAAISYLLNKFGFDTYHFDNRL